MTNVALERVSGGLLAKLLACVREPAPGPTRRSAPCAAFVHLWHESGGQVRGGQVSMGGYVRGWASSGRLARTPRPARSSPFQTRRTRRSPLLAGRLVPRGREAWWRTRLGELERWMWNTTRALCLLVTAVTLILVVNVMTLRTPRNRQRPAPGWEEKGNNALSTGEREECLAMQADHGVVVGSSWGSLPRGMVDRWRALSCDRHASATGGPSMWHWFRGLSDHRAAGASVGFVSRCTWLRQQYPDMRVGLSWGSMPPVMQDEWKRMRCDAEFRSQVADSSYEGRYIGAFERVLREALMHRTERLVKAPNATVVAIGVSTTTRTLDIETLEDLALFNTLLPSLVRSAQRKFFYWLYIAYDVGDPFYDRRDNRARALEWIERRVKRVLSEERGIQLEVALLRFNNTLRKPGPVFNYMMAAAAEDGADYLYRINDDTELMNDNWTSSAVDALTRFHNVGVAGPVCNEGNTNIMTHDFVHRTHLYIFRTYYPPVFTDWYMDDWISLVYGAPRTQKGPFLVVHHINKHSTRYDVDQSHEFALEREIQTGRRRIVQYCRLNGSCGPLPLAS